MYSGCTVLKVSATAIDLNVPPMTVTIVIMCDRMNEEKLALFTQKVKEILNIPPTQYALRVGSAVGQVWD